MSAVEELDLEWTFGDRLRKARRTAGLSQQELADAINVKVQRLSNWEAGINTPRDLVDTARSVEAATDVPAAWLLGLSSRWSLLREVQAPPGQMELALDTGERELALAWWRTSAQSGRTSFFGDGNSLTRHRHR